MKLFRICIISLLAACSATITYGQYGLYGSPDTIQMPQQTPYTVPPGGYAASPSGYTAPSSYVAQQPVQQYPAQQAQPYAAQTAQPYPSQQMQPYATQPMQPYATQQTQPYPVQQMQPAKSAVTYGQMGPQYRAPAYSRPTYYTASADKSAAGQPMPVPQMAPTSQTPVLTEPMSAPGIQQNTSVTNQMLAEQGQSSSSSASGGEGYATYGGQCGVYRPEVNRFEQSACGNCDYGCSEPSLWYASISGLVMTRDRPNKVYITYETGNLPNNDFPVDEFGWRWGGEVRVGRRFCGGCNSGCNSGYWALEGSYWTLDNFQSFVSHTSPVSATNPYGTVGTPLRVSDIEFGGSPGTTWFDEAAEHRLWRRDEVHNVEMNIVRGQWCYGQDSPWDLGWSLGVRYFRFQESWRFGSLAGPLVPGPGPGPAHYWGEAGGLYEAYLSDQITNNLIGPQLGFELGYNMWNSLRFYMAPKVGIYNNHISNNFQASLGNGTIATTGSSGVPGTYPVDSSTNSIAFLTQVDVGLDWKFARQWSAQFGYRVVTVSGIGLADAQIPFYIVDIPAIAEIDRNSDLILHGAYLTLSYNF